MLGRFEQRRAADIEAIARLQFMQSKAMLSHGALATRIRPAATRLLKHTPVYRKVLDRIAYGNHGIQVEMDSFVDG